MEKETEKVAEELNRTELREKRFDLILEIIDSNYRSLEYIFDQHNKQDPENIVSKPTISSDLQKMIDNNKVIKSPRTGRYIKKGSTPKAKNSKALRNFILEHCIEYKDLKDLDDPKVIFVEKGYEQAFCQHIYDVYNTEVLCIHGNGAVLIFGDEQKLLANLDKYLNETPSKNNENEDFDTIENGSVEETAEDI
jgi:hypothetical protein